MAAGADGPVSAGPAETVTAKSGGDSKKVAASCGELFTHFDRYMPAINVHDSANLRT